MSEIFIRLIFYFFFLFLYFLPMLPVVCVAFPFSIYFFWFVRYLCDLFMSREISLGCEKLPSSSPQRPRQLFIFYVFYLFWRKLLAQK